MELDTNIWELLEKALQQEGLTLYAHQSLDASRRAELVPRNRAGTGYLAHDGRTLEEALKNIANCAYHQKSSNHGGPVVGETRSSSPLDEWILRGNDIRISWNTERAEGYWRFAADRPLIRAFEREVVIIIKEPRLKDAVNQVEKGISALL